MIPLSSVPSGKSIIVLSFQCGRRLAWRLFEMGILPGARYKVVSNLRWGPVILEKDGMRLGLGHGMAEKILVRVV